MGGRRATHERPRWVAIVASVLRTFVASVLIVASAVVSMAAPETPTTLALAILALLAFWTLILLLFIRWQVHGIGASPIPVVRGIEAVIVGLVLFISIFAKAYLLISHAVPTAFTEPLDGFTAYYYTITVLSTVGFGDITPTGVLARSVTMTQMILDLAFVAVTARIIFSQVKASQERRRSSPADPGSGTK